MAEASFAQKAEYRMEFEPYPRRVTVVFNDVTLADSRKAMILRETRLEPIYYLPVEDVRRLAKTYLRLHLEQGS